MLVIRQEQMAALADAVRHKIAGPWRNASRKADRRKLRKWVRPVHHKLVRCMEKALLYGVDGGGILQPSPSSWSMFSGVRQGPRSMRGLEAAAVGLDSILKMELLHFRMTGRPRAV